MSGRRPAGDRGQAFPIYVVAVVALLFAALVFFVVGRAAVTRSNAQGAADAAALAAAREARDSLLPGVDLGALKSEDWTKVLRGAFFDPKGACAKAEDFAARNDAKGTCTQDRLRFTVSVKTDDAVGDSVVPGTSGMHGTADATAEIEPQCTVGPSPKPGSSPSQPPPSDGTPAPPDPPGPVTIKCRSGDDIVFDPLHPKPWSTLARSLFKVRLVD
ncbi:pilus assembly protein TadG-related protein [Streptomyces antimicrobicus]|uniref:Pilus assembly protein TadG-related protein n=1 Tax=Streptomyces antimicrobicus TaxID=2883108 RepID=A0ABS8BD62_9ACTN|nr:pilus assembly protein TadG-related protein [Streptomyces antimicrobicus]MCB5182469.1 pilus assembly protein TadG-related protein [Streptomyces antimicrobicus]